MELTQIYSHFRTFLLNIELTWRLLMDYRVPFSMKFFFVGIFIAYLVFPVDLLPDFFPALGQFDDFVVFVLCMLQFIKSVPVEIVGFHKSAILDGEWKIKFLKYLT